MTDTLTTIVAALIAGGLPALLSWFVLDARSKGRAVEAEKRDTENRARGETSRAELYARLNAAEKDLVRSQQDREELHRGLVRIEETKASKELLEVLRTDVADLKNEMDKRFDRLERLFEVKRP